MQSKMGNELTQASILILGKKDVGTLSKESTKPDLIYFTWKTRNVGNIVFFFFHIRPYSLFDISIPLGHDVKQNLNAGILLPTVIE